MSTKPDNNSAKLLFGLFGAGGFAREVMPLFSKETELEEVSKAQYSIEHVFVDTLPTERLVNGFSVLSDKQFFSKKNDRLFFNVAIGDGKLRKIVADDCMAKGAEPVKICAKTSLIGASSKIGRGAILCDYTVITENARIGEFFHANIYSYVAHDSVIGNYVTFAPRVSCNGNVHIHDNVYVGTGAVLKQGTSENPLVIGEGAVVGMGAVVTKNVPANTVVVGNPAKPLKKLSSS